jgi:hypothetical protein
MRSGNEEERVGLIADLEELGYACGLDLSHRAAHAKVIQRASLVARPGEDYPPGTILGAHALSSEWRKRP